MVKINPFQPNNPVPAAMFAGRMNEIESLEKGLHQTLNGYNSNFLLTGERGIGKSSLLSYIKYIAEGSITSPDYSKFNFIPVNVTITERTDLAAFINLIQINLQREIGKTEVIRNFLKTTWEFAKRIKVMDSGIDNETVITDIDIIINQFSYSLAETCKRVTSPDDNDDVAPKDGIVFFIDEADNASSDLHIGIFFKVVTELLQQHGCNNIMFIAAGLPEVLEKLSSSHESSIRIFTQLKIEVLNPVDRKYVISKGIERGNEINNEKTTISDEAIEQVAKLSEGYPHFIQQFGYSAFEANKDGEISIEDVLDGAFDQGGAIDAIGSRYYAAAYHEKIKSDDYREVLRIMAGNMNAWIKKKEIREKFSGNDQTVTDALAALTARKIILKNTSKQGEYRLQHRGFALWIKLFAERKE